MPLINAGPIIEEIFVPECILASASMKMTSTQGARNSSPSYNQLDNPDGEIKVQKKRQPTVSWAPDEVDIWEAPGRQTSRLFALEEMRGKLVPTAEEDGGPSDPQPPRSRNISFRLHWSKAIRYSQPGGNFEGLSGSNTHGLSRERTYSAPLPLRQSSGTARKTRNSSLRSLYNMADLVNIKRQRQYWKQLLIEYGTYTALAAFVYFVLVGVPLWKGAVCWLYWVMQHKLVFSCGWAIAIALIIFFSFIPLLHTFEKKAPGPEYYQQRHITPATTDTALLIPCYKSGHIIGRTLEAALKIFPASHVYVIANGNSSSPLDNTEAICRTYGVNHIWCPVGSKIVALFIGCYAVKHFRYVLLIDDDCILPPNFPVVVSRLTNHVRCIGYTIKSVSSDSLKGSYCQQAQDLEYKLAGLQRSFAGRLGSATFPHGAISLWERTFLKDTLRHHPGFSISEDWFLGNSCRRLGGRIQMCSAVFVETTTPSAFIWTDRNRSRGGFGETTVLQQRFLRWNFFVANAICHNLVYIFGSWKLGWWEIGAKLFVIQEVYETMLYLLTPFLLPISLLIRPLFCISLLLTTFGLYLLNAIIFNEIHLRLKNERVQLKILLWYYMPYKVLISLMNVASCYWSLYKYARYFAKRHPKLNEDHKAVGMVLKLEEMTQKDRGHRMR
ncbi:glycosyltransferase like family 2-domain-containing protein [Penicillium samsonianum]|uniref:glycosyltransferase like family 2-domain-containing protein n=1 Tax=Penicillium samsonianum TaxID=1882272 RepID=UPI002547BBFE|nr:glycosyltransferase like family 2-domain-containing protein [Penicillium samsonianum]KAJ6118341.1 glycosyltransferase like family 2-domain-containing protein [Penicillium samsonianum]